MNVAACDLQVTYAEVITASALALLLLALITKSPSASNIGFWPPLTSPCRARGKSALSSLAGKIPAGLSALTRSFRGLSARKSSYALKNTLKQLLRGRGYLRTGGIPNALRCTSGPIVKSTVRRFSHERRSKGFC
mgnify:CR=1 FL=1